MKFTYAYGLLVPTALLCSVGLRPACAAGAAETTPPLARPAPPQVEIRGTPGSRTLRYWQFATDARGHSRYSDVAVVTNAPDTLSEQNAVVLTPSPVPAATEYGILTTRIEAPREAEIEIGAEGGKTFYYWFQARNGRTVWSPVEGPIVAEGCAEKPENTLTWSPTGAEFYYLYRTETRALPMNWRNCVILSAKPATQELTWSDTGLSPDSRIIYPAGTAERKPEGHGRYLVGKSRGDAIVDAGQQLLPVTMYDMNTTDSAYTQFKPEVKGYEPGGDRGAFQFDFDNRSVSPQYSWDMFNGIAIHQRNIAGGLNTYPYERGVHYETAKNTYNGIDIHQFNYTASQHSPYLAYMYNYGVGDNVLLHAGIDQEGQNRDAGDEGTEFFSLHLKRRLSVDQARVAADAQPGDIYLRTEGSLGQIAAGRGLVNLTRVYREGSARVEQGAIAVGDGTQWTPDMEGWYISFDADTTTAAGKPVRQWYRVRQYLSPTKLRLLAYAYYRMDAYKGKATADGPYLLCPYTEMSDGDAVTARGLRVAPLQCAWGTGDEIEVIAGPASTVRLGWWEIQGDFLPQDHVAGLGIMYGGKKPTNEGALICYNWSTSVESHNANVGLTLYNTKAGMLLYKESPVIASVIRDDPYRFQLAHNAGGFVIEDHGGRPWVSLGVDGIALHGTGTLKGTDRTRGRALFSGDGQTRQFKIGFPAGYPAKPFVVASSNVPIGMGVTETTPEGCTVTFASPPAAGADNVEVTWMVQE